MTVTAHTPPFTFGVSTPTEPVRGVRVSTRTETKHTIEIPLHCLVQMLDSESYSVGDNPGISVKGTTLVLDWTTTECSDE